MKLSLIIKKFFALAGIFIAILMVNHLNFSDNPIKSEEGSENNLKLKLKCAGYWNLTGNPIFINGSAKGVGAHNWSWAESQEWCNGSGTLNAPYVIENVTIDGLATGSCIDIVDSSVYFTIKNCTILNSKNSMVCGGIRLDNVSNGKLIKNNCSFNGLNGILLLGYCENNTIIKNNVNNNDIGIRVIISTENNVSLNNISNNNICGINLIESQNTSISENTFNNNGHGIYCDTGNYNHITRNIFNKNNWSGVSLFDYSNYNNISNNIMNDNKILNGQGISIRDSVNNTIMNNDIINNLRGIQLYRSDDCNITNNYISNNSIYGIFFEDDCDSNEIVSNIIKSNNNSGINIGFNSDDNLIYYNSFINNRLHAIDNGTNNIWDNGTIGNYWDNYTGTDANDDGIGDNNYTIDGTSISNDTVPIWNDGPNGDKIFVDDSDPNNNWKNARFKFVPKGSGIWDDPFIIENVAINGLDSGNCIEIRNSDVYFIIRNCTFYNSSGGMYEAGIKLEGVNNSQLINNNCSNNKRNGIYLFNSNNNTIFSNIAENNDIKGIYLESSNDTKLSENKIYSNYNRGIDLKNCENNFIFNNSIKDSPFGIYLHTCNDNNITENIGNDNEKGIYLYSCFNNRIFSNFMYDNVENGIKLAESSYNVFSDNFINNSLEIGIGLDWTCSYNNFTGNIIKNSMQYGVFIKYSDTHNNTFFLNSFYNNGINAIDNGTNNYWDYTNLGNYWSDYSGSDLNDDGIGDDPYNINGTANSIDYKPIWYDEWYTDKIFIDDNNPNFNWSKTMAENLWCTGSGTWNDPYIIDNVIIDGKNSGSCIEIQNSNEYFIIQNSICFNSESSTGSDYPGGIKLNNTNNGKIILNNCSNNGWGIILLDSNNISGNENFIENNDGGIFLHNSNYNTFKQNSVNNNRGGFLFYGIFISSSDNNTFIVNNASNNEYAINFVSSNNNSILGNILVDNDKGIIFGALMPSENDNNIFINNIIHNNTLYGVEIGEPFIGDSSDNLFYNNSFSNPDGTNAIDDGDNNMWYQGTVGNYWHNYAGVDNDDNSIGDALHPIPGSGIAQDLYPIWHDAPDIIIYSPISSNISGENAPLFNVSITDPNLHTMWYTLDNGITNVIFFSNGTINQSLWDVLGNGTIMIKFYANDSVGNIGFARVMFRKDIIAPNINIIFPIQNQFCGINAPTFNLSITEGNLVSKWYSLDGGLTNETFTGLSDIINQTIWESIPNSTIVTIRFYAIDITGHINFEDVDIVKFYTQKPGPVDDDENKDDNDDDDIEKEGDVNFTLLLNGVFIGTTGALGGYVLILLNKVKKLNKVVDQQKIKKKITQKSQKSKNK